MCWGIGRTGFFWGSGAELRELDFGLRMESLLMND